MPEDQIREIIKKLDNLTETVFKIEGVVQNSRHEKDVDELKEELLELRRKHSSDVSDIYSLIREHEKDNHSGKALSQVLINLATMVGTIGAMYLMMKG